MSKQRLHPIAILFNFIKVTWQFIYVFILVYTIPFKSVYYSFLLIGAILLFFITHGILSWLRFSYRVEENELRIEYGILIRKKRYIPMNRIQSIDLTSSVVHRLFRLTKVNIETAGSGTSADASLSAVKFSEGERLRKELTIHKEVEEEMDGEVIAPDPIDRISFKRLFIAGSTSGSIGAILLLAFFALSEVEQFIPGEFYDQSVQWIISLSIVFIVSIGFIVLLILYMLGIAGTMIKYGNFTITKKNDELFITRGLLEKKELTIPLRRIQAVAIEESLIRQPFGFVTISVQLAGGSLEQVGDSSVLFPIMRTDEVEGFLQMFLPRYAELPTAVKQLPKRARKFYLFRSLIPVAVIGAVVWYNFPQFSWIVIVLLLASMGLGLLRHRDGGYLIEDKRIIARYRVLSKVTMIMFHPRIQSIEKKQHKIQSFQSLATIRLSVTGLLGAGAHYIIKDLDVEDANLIADWYSYRPELKSKSNLLSCNGFSSEVQTNK